MIFLTKDEAQKWCVDHKVHINERSLLPPETAVEFKIPSDAGHRVALVREQLESFRSCEEILIWIRDWSVWGSGERMHIFDRFRQSYGESRALHEIPAHLINNKEYEDGLSIVTLAVLFLWDCYILTNKGEKFCFYSHDEFGLIKEDYV